MTNSKNIIEAILDDHKEINAYYEQYLANAGNDKEQQKWANQLIWEVARHSVAEELVLYPLIEKKLPDGKALADKDRAQHMEAKKDLYQLEKLKAGTREFDDLIARTIRDLREHIKEEEQIDLPKIQAAISAEESLKVGKEFQRTKHFVPTRSHPSAPDKPPFETLAGLLAAPMDKLGDMLRKFPSNEEKKAAVSL
ncbi:hypothetical protein HK097_002555 [Rhizophlyctis rosea]|uniref:Hemerythrin-like domain-containing protein n=1 Tax=Rhizophlyctis rosea TaxID=64517 RepID=A0AAD5X0K7_9FUNG|nr:hypothetical protein HK097_002555 [Rhizophlyctis rosea]